MYRLPWNFNQNHESAEMTRSALVFRRTLIGAIAVVCVGLLGCQNAPVPVEVDTPAVAEKLSGAQIAELKKLGFVEEAEGWTFNISDSKLLFDFGQHTLNAKGAALISDIARGLIQVGLVKIRAEGHSDTVGRQSFNEALSLRRAEHVAKQLVMGGFKDANVIRHGFGAAKPVADNATAEGRAQNRRVTLIIVVD